MYIVMKNSAGCELDRKQVFHDDYPLRVLRDWIAELTELQVGTTFKVVDGDER